MGEVEHNCGIALVHSLKDAYDILGEDGLRHRGKEAAGVGAKNDDGIDIVKWIGTVDNFALKSLQTSLEGCMYACHNRYRTFGKRDRKSILRGAHPHFINGTEIDKNTHISIRGADCVVVHNGQIPRRFINKNLNTTERNKLRTRCDSEAFLHLYKKLGPEELVKKIPGVYSAIFLDKKNEEAIAVRDRFGMRPMWLGEKDGKFIIASEDQAIRHIGGTDITEVPPGAVAYIRSKRFKNPDIVTVVESDPAFCFFEFNYLAHRDSHFTSDKIHVADVRYRLGIQLGEEFPIKSDFVTYVPSSPEQVMFGYSEKTSVPFKRIFYKQRDTDRSFLETTLKSRKRNIKENLYLRDDADIRGKIIVIVDDSIIRGNVSEEAVKLCRENGAKAVYILSTTSPIGGLFNNTKGKGCNYGLDMPDKDEFVSAKYPSHQAFADAIGATGVYYISKQGMFKALRLQEYQVCARCIGGRDPLQQYLAA